MKRSAIQTLLTRVFFVAYWFVLTVGLLLPRDSRFVRVAARIPSLSHFAAFAVLAFLAHLARWPWQRWRLAIVLAAYAVATELIQSFVPGRFPDWNDAIEDFAGIALGLLAARVAEASLTRLWSQRPGSPGQPHE